MAYPTQGQSPYGDDLKDYIDLKQTAAQVSTAITAAAGQAPTATTAQLENVAHAINTANKVAGKSVFNTTTGAPVWAVGSAAADVWNDATGASTHTPV